MQAYSNPSREEETYSLPDIEVWKEEITEVECPCGTYDVPTSAARAVNCVYCPSCDREAIGACDTDRSGWFYWFCLPGYLPDSDVMGPFETEKEALDDARGE